MYVGKELFPVLDHVLWWLIINPLKAMLKGQKPSWPKPKVFGVTKEDGGWIYLDTVGDKYRARMVLNRFLRDYPDSELRSQVEYMLENMSRANFNTPESIEDLRELND